MCGIAGIVWQDPRRPGDRAAAQAMTDALAHRGPDGAGLEVQGPAALGHRRLKVIDLSEAARQPIPNEDGSVWLVFNGEVYNFVELREGLEARGHVFRSKTDAEVLVHLYEEKGADLVDDLVGMFAFAIWDVPNQTLLLGRDRAGQKPLHYRIDDDALRFASEPAALLADPTAPARGWDAVAVHHYVHYGYVPSGRSAFAGAHKLPPAHVLTWRPGEPARLRRYWFPSFGPKAGPDPARVDDLAARLEESVRLRLVSDVPLGAFLSGGIDSGLIVSTMAPLLSERAQTFTIGFDVGAYDERALAAEVAALYHTEHHERVVPADHALELLPLLVQRYGEPFADSSALPTYRVAELAKEHVTVALSGDAGDELFAGYLRHSANEAGRLYGHVPKPLRQALAALIERIPNRPRPRDPIRYAKRFVRAFEQDIASRNATWGMVMKPETAALLYQEDFARRVADAPAVDVYRRVFDEADATCDEERVLWADFALYQPDDILVKVDIATMCHGLEARAPFLDHRFVEWAMRLPLREKVHLGQRKRLLRALAARRLPRAVTQGGKRGFAIPLDAWFRGPLVPLFRETVLAPDARTAEIFRPEAVAGLLAQHLARRWDWQHELWSILWLELWFREMKV